MSEDVEIIKKICIKCGEEKEINEENFRFRYGRPVTKCKNCMKLYDFQRYEERLKKENKVKVIRIKLDKNATHKICNECKQLKNIKKDFSSLKMYYCKNCNILKFQTWLSDPINKAKKINTDKLYIQNNREKISMRRRNTAQNHKIKLDQLFLAQYVIH